MATRPHNPPAPVAAFMDLGTTSVRLSVVRINPNHSVTVLTQQREAIRLGDGEFRADAIQPEAMERAVQVCGRFAAMARGFGAGELIAVATSATREAHNQAELLRRLRDEAGVEVHVISGSEEARLIYRGVASGLHLDDRTALFIDIGGGSTELIVGNQQRHFFLDSLKLGAIRLSNLYLKGREQPVPPALYRRLTRHVRDTAVRDLQRLRLVPFALAVGSSGTIETLGAVAALSGWKRPWGPDDVLGSRQLKETIAWLCALPLAERRKVPGLSPERADIIIGGAAIIDTLMDELGLAELRISSRGLRDGLLVEYLSRTDAAPLVQETPVRERSVLHLGRLCAFDEPHAKQVARLALALFDDAAALGLQALGPRERELLGHAALLHDLGAFLAYHNHHAHTYYFIRHTELLGFDQREIDIMAVTALFHRKTFPRKKHPEFAVLDEGAQGAVRILCVLLRLAESLDRSHAAAVAEVRLHAVDAQQVLLEVCAARDCQLELWGAGHHLDAFARVFGRRLHIGAAE